MQRILRCFAELDASLVLGMPRPDLIRALTLQYGLSEEEAKTVLLEKENEIAEKAGGDGPNPRVFSRSGTVVYVSSERRTSHDAATPGDPRSPQQRVSPPASPHGQLLAFSPPRGGEPPFDYVGSPPTPTGGFQRSSGRLSFSSPARTGSPINVDSAGGPSSHLPTVMMMDLAPAEASAAARAGLARSPSMEDLLIDPISMELMKKPVMLPCGHSFSRRTITKWLQQHNTCPTCNTLAVLEDLQPNYALRTVVQHYKEAQRREARGERTSTSTSASILVLPGGEVTKTKKKKKKKKKNKSKAEEVDDDKPSSSSGKKDKKKDKKVKQKKRSGNDDDAPTRRESAGGAEQLSPFAFFNAWVNGKDKKAKEERQARQRDGDDDYDGNDDEAAAGAFSPTSTSPTSAARGLRRSAPERSAFATGQLLQDSPFRPSDQMPLPQQPEIVLSGAWFDGFMENGISSTTTTDPGYQSFADSGASHFTASLASSTATVGTAAGLFGADPALPLAGDVSLGGFLGDDGGAMGSVGFSSSLFSFDDPPVDRTRANDEEPEEEKEQEDDDEDDEEENDDDNDDSSSSSDEEEEDDEDMQGRSGTVVLGPSADESDTFESGGSGRKKQKKKTKKKHKEGRQAERADRKRRQGKMPLRHHRDVDDATRIIHQTPTTVDEAVAAERKLRLALDVEFPQLRYDVQHKGVHVVVSVRAQAAPNDSLRAVSSLVASAHHHHHNLVQAPSASSSSSSLSSTSTATAAADDVGPIQGVGGERAQIAVIAAIDRSSSMKGDMPLVKESLKFLISQLSPGDCMGLVSYDGEVTTDVSLTFLDDVGKDLVLRAVSSIETGMWTNISGGLFSALKLLEKLPSNPTNLVCSVLLFTDGGANRGLTTTEQILTALDAELRLLQSKSLAPTVFTFGFGSAPDAAMLTKIAERGDGVYYAIETAEAIPSAFADCLGGLLSVCAENIRVRLEAQGGATIGKVHGNWSVEKHSPHTSYSLLLGDIYYEETRDVLVSLNLPALDQPAASSPLLSATLTYSSLPDGRHTTVSAECHVSRPVAADVPPNPVPSYEVDKQRNRVLTADAIKRAITEQEERRFDNAVAILTEATQQIQQSVSAADPFCLSLVENLDECSRRTQKAKESNRANKTAYQASLALAHSRQRSTHAKGTLTYKTSAKASTSLKCETATKKGQARLDPAPAPPKSGEQPHQAQDDLPLLLFITKQLFERIRLIYALVGDECNPKACPTMTAGSKFEYRWQDKAHYPQPTSLPAAHYMELLFTHTESLFTQPPSMVRLRESLRRLFRVYAHIYYHHYILFEDIGEMKLLQSSFVAFVKFVQEYRLVDERELLPMHALIHKLAAEGSL